MHAPLLEANPPLTWGFVSKVGLVLGGGGITGASYEMASLIALEMATGWDPDAAEVIVGTSAGAFVAAIVRSGALSVDAIVGTAQTGPEVADQIRSTIYRRTKTRGVRRWLRHGVLPSIRRPGVTAMLGSPAPHDPTGISEWLRDRIGDAADTWPDKPTVAVAYELGGKRRTAFGTHQAPDASLGDAVAASSALPLVFNPHEIEGKLYVDGGVVSGTHADLVLGNPQPLDLVVTLAPMAFEDAREGGAFYEHLLDRAGARALNRELDLIAQAWPDTETLVLRPGPEPLEVMRPNPMSSDAAVLSFIHSLRSLKTTLAKPAIWNVLDRHLGQSTAA